MSSQIDDVFTGISRVSGTSVEEIKKKFEEMMNNEWIKNDTSFSSDEERKRYVVGVLYSKYTLGPPVQEYQIVPLGHFGLSMTKNNKPRDTLMAVVRDKGKVERRCIVFNGEVAVSVPNIVLKASYKVMLGKFADGGDLVVGNRTAWESPASMNLGHLSEFYEKKLGVKRVTTKDVGDFPSKKRSDGYVDNLDWRIIRGFIAPSPRTFVGKDGTTKAVCTISDSDSQNLEEVDETSGEVRRGFTVWLSPDMLKWAEESECDFVGIVRKDLIKDKDDESQTQTFQPQPQKLQRFKVSMNAFDVIPIHARPISGGGNN